MARWRGSRARDPVGELARALFRAARAPLAVGWRLALDGATCVDDLAQLRARDPDGARSMPSVPSARGAFDALLWRVEGDPRAGLSALRRLLSPGARVLLVAAPPAYARLRALFAREASSPPGLEQLCDALILSGLCEPRVHQPAAGLLLVSAELPARPDPLDVFFEQPAAAANR